MASNCQNRNTIYTGQIQFIGNKRKHHKIYQIERDIRVKQFLILDLGMIQKTAVHNYVNKNLILKFNAEKIWVSFVVVQ